MAALIDEVKGVEIINRCKAEGNIETERVQWEYIQEFLRKNHFLYLDSKGNRIIKLSDGVRIPWTNIQIVGSMNQPIDPHIVTVADGLEAKALSNWPFLQPFVRPATADDKDQDTAKSCTLLLQHYRESLNDEDSYRKLIGYMKPCGNAFIKSYWDVNAGNYGAMSADGTVPVRMGDLACKIIMPSRMLIPKAIGSDDELPWIGEQYALPVEEIEDLWRTTVPEEANLEELQFLRSVDYSGVAKQDRLKGHARVYEIYMKPTKRHPLGRLVIVCNQKILYDGPWDALVTETFPDMWHPYDHVSWIRLEGDYWAKSPLYYITEHQIQLNKLYKKYVESTRYSKGWWQSTEGAVDRKKINWDSETGTPWIESMRGMPPPQYVPPPLAKMEYLNGMNQIRAWMNDITAMYEVTRGNADPSITSGRQVQSLQMANSSQHSPLLSGLARAWISVWQKRLRLCAVHFEDVGRTIRVIGENNDIVATRFTPDQITSDDIALATGQSFFLPPELRIQELDRAYQSGLMGDPNSTPVKKRYMELRGLGGGTEELYADYTADVTRARYENDLFESGQFYETDPLLIKQSPQMQQYQQAIQGWQQQRQMYDQAVQMVQTGQMPPPQVQPDMNGAMPTDAAGSLEMAGLQNPGPPPQEPKVYLLARSYDDDDTHIEILNRFRKTHKFEELCKQNPELRMATDAHYQSHMDNKNKLMQGSPMVAQMQADQNKQLLDFAKTLVMAYGRSNGVPFPMNNDALLQVENTLFNKLEAAAGGPPIQASPPGPQSGTPIGGNPGGAAPGAIGPVAPKEPIVKR